MQEWTEEWVGFLGGQGRGVPHSLNGRAREGLGDSAVVPVRDEQWGPCPLLQSVLEACCTLGHLVRSGWSVMAQGVRMSFPLGPCGRALSAPECFRHLERS